MKLTEKQHLNIASEAFKMNQSVLFAFNVANITTHIVFICRSYTSIGRMPWGGNPWPGNHCIVSIKEKGMHYLEINRKTSVDYIAEKFYLPRVDAEVFCDVWNNYFVELN